MVLRRVCCCCSLRTNCLLFCVRAHALRDDLNTIICACVSVRKIIVHYTNERARAHVIDQSENVSAMSPTECEICTLFFVCLRVCVFVERLHTTNTHKMHNSRVQQIAYNILSPPGRLGDGRDGLQSTWARSG